MSETKNMINGQSINRQLVKIQTGEFILTDLNQTPVTCPHQNAVVLPGNLQGQLVINRPPCSSACAMFCMETIHPQNAEMDLPGMYEVTLKCSPSEFVMGLAAEVLQEKKSGSAKIIQ